MTADNIGSRGVTGYEIRTALGESQAQLEGKTALVCSRGIPFPRRRPLLMDTFPDLGSLSDQELKDLIQQLTDEEVEVSYRRRILHGKIDILRAELVNRLRKKHETGEDVISGADVQRLTDILAGRNTQE
jgi:hypothetical protein